MSIYIKKKIAFGIVLTKKINLIEHSDAGCTQKIFLDLLNVVTTLKGVI